MGTPVSRIIGSQWWVKDSHIDARVPMIPDVAYARPYHGARLVGMVSFCGSQYPSSLRSIRSIISKAVGNIILENVGDVLCDAALSSQVVAGL